MSKKYRRLERRKMKRTLKNAKPTLSTKRKIYESKGEYLARLDFFEKIYETIA
jgi:hypothetical protein